MTCCYSISKSSAMKDRSRILLAIRLLAYKIMGYILLADPPQQATKSVWVKREIIFKVWDPEEKSIKSTDLH